MFTFVAANCGSRLSTVLIIYCEKTSRLRHDSWNLRAYSLELEDGDVSKSESFIHMFTNTAALPGECEPARGAGEAGTSRVVPGLLALTSQPGRWTWAQTDSIKWRRDEGAPREHRCCAQEGSWEYIVECLLSGKRSVKHKTGEEGGRQINNHLLNASYASRCQTQC